MNIGFYIENTNEIEKAKLLIKTIKQHIKDANIHAVTKYEIKLHDCKIIKSEFIIHDNLYFVDKVQAASIFESMVSTPYMWVDIDTIFLKPVDDICKEISPICVNPVDIKNIGIHKNQNFSEIWSKTMKFLDLKAMNHYVTTRISREIIFPYYNMGMVYVNKHCSLFKKTYESIIKLSNNDLIKESINDNPLHRVFYHQLVFSLLVEKLYNRHILDLGENINYPLHLMEKDIKSPNTSQLVSIRYDTYFEHHELPEFLKKTINMNKTNL